MRKGDDGSLHNQGLHLNTYGFTAEEIFNLKEVVENMFGENSLTPVGLAHWINL